MGSDRGGLVVLVQDILSIPATERSQHADIDRVVNALANQLDGTIAKGDVDHAGMQRGRAWALAIGRGVKVVVNLAQLRGGRSEGCALIGSGQNQPRGLCGRGSTTDSTRSR